MNRNGRGKGSPESNNNSEGGNDPIEERLLDGREESQEGIVDAARQSFTEDQRDPDHPSRVERRAGEVEDPSHSRGSASRE